MLNDMFTIRDPLARTLLIVFAGLTSLALLIASIALLIWVTRSGSHDPPQSPAVVGVAVDDPKAISIARASVAAGTPASVAKPAGGKRFTLRLGQGFCFKDGALVAKQDDPPDIVAQNRSGDLRRAVSAGSETRAERSSG